MERFFNYRDRWGNGLALWIVLAMFFSLPITFIGLRQLRLDNDVTSWLPDEDQDAAVLNWFQSQFAENERMLVSWDSSYLGDPRINDLVQHLEGNGDHPIPGVSEVTTPQSLVEQMLDNGIDEETAVDRLTGVLIGSGFLKVRLTDAGREEQASIQAALQSEVSQFDQKASIVPALEVPQASESVDDSENQAPVTVAIPPHDFQIRGPELSASSASASKLIETLESYEWNGKKVVESAFFHAGAPIAVSISLNQYGSEYVADTLAQIQEAALASGIEEPEFRMGGSPVGRERLNSTAARVMWNPEYPMWNLYKFTPGVLSAVVSLVLSYLVLRSFRLATLVSLTSLYTVCVVMSLIPAAGKSLNMVLIVLPDLLLVLTASGAIHVANYWKYSVAQKAKNPIAQAVGMAWQPCMLASVTTAIGMASLMTSILTPVQEFGMYSSIGCLISLAMILLGFPAMMSLWPASHDHTQKSAETDHRVWTWMGELLAHHRIAVCTLCLVIFGTALYGLQWFKTETKVITYFPSHSRIVKDYEFLEEGLAGLVTIDAVVAFDEQKRDEMNILERTELVRDIEKKISEHRWISGTLSLADFRPVTTPPADDDSFRTKVMYGRRAQRTEKAIFDERSESTQSLATLNDSPLSMAYHDRQIDFATGDEIWRIRAQAAVLGEVRYDVLTDDLNTIVRESLKGDKGTTYAVTGLVPLFQRTQIAVLESLIRSFAIAFGIIAVVMVALLRNPISGLMAMLPNLFPVGVVFGFVSWSSIPVDIGTMITASVALGIAIDGTLHLLTWFQDGIRNGYSKRVAMIKALQHCGPAMWQTSVSIALGILMLAGADLLLIHRFGWLMCALIMMALIADVVLLPVLLVGWLGTLIAKANGIDESTLSDSLHDDDEDGVISFTAPAVDASIADAM